MNKGPIGLKASGGISRLFMIWWDRMFISLACMAGLLVYMYKRYVDDGNIVLEAVPSNKVYDENETKLVETNSDISEEPDKHTSKIVKEIANSVTKMLVWDEDYPSKYDDNKLPMLDLKVGIKSLKGGGSRIVHRFYKKTMASKEMITRRSAMPTRSK